MRISRRRNLGCKAKKRKREHVPPVDDRVEVVMGVW
jgi:hypothetical protein